MSSHPTAVSFLHVSSDSTHTTQVSASVSPKCSSSGRSGWRFFITAEINVLHPYPSGSRFNVASFLVLASNSGAPGSNSIYDANGMSLPRQVVPPNGEQYRCPVIRLPREVGILFEESTEIRGDPPLRWGWRHRTFRPWSV